MSLSPMSHVEFKKCQCHLVDFRGQAPYWSCTHSFKVALAINVFCVTSELRPFDNGSTLLSGGCVYKIS